MTMGTFQDAFSDQPVKAALPATDDKADAAPDVPEEELDAAEEAAEPSSAKEPEAPAEEPKVEAQPREPNGKFAKTVPQEALHAERERRREVEARLAEFEKNQNKPKTSVLEDEDKAFTERLSEATRPLVQRLFNMSLAAAKRVPGREDFDDIYSFMNEEVQRHPELMRDIDAAEDPGEYIYSLGKTRKELSEVGGDLTKYREHAVASVSKELKAARARIQALEAEAEARKATDEKRSKIPSSTNTEQSGSPKDEVFAGPRPLKSVFNS
jgi:hypothetical protein